MKRSLFFAALALAAAFAHAQNLTTDTAVTSTAGASNQGVSTTFNSYGTPVSVVTSDVKTNQAAGLGTVLASPPVQNTCDSGGYGIGGGIVSGSALVTLPGRTEIGCDAVRDTNIMVYVEDKLQGNSQKIARARICKKAEIETAYKDAGLEALCKTTAQKVADAAASQPVAQGYSVDPLIAARQHEASRGNALTAFRN